LRKARLFPTIPRRRRPGGFEFVPIDPMPVNQGRGPFVLPKFKGGIDMAHQSSWSRGEGSRRWPGRPGGARKRKTQGWEHQAVHRVSSLENLPPPVVTFLYRKPWGKDTAESIYLFDQEAARAGIAYYAEYGAGSSRWPAFSIWVNEKDREAVREIIERLNPPYRPKRSARFSGWWCEIEPTRLSKSSKDHPWVFAIYRESGSQRDDGMSYTAFLFRDRDRTVFGVKEWFGVNVIVKNDVLEKLAHRVVTDAEFRRSLLSDDPDLPLLWKKR
jgi:hypothetical protein